MFEVGEYIMCAEDRSLSCKVLQEIRLINWIRRENTIY